MLTEQEVAKSWRKIIQLRVFSDDTFAKLESLIDELRPESPLRHRLCNELAELRRMHRVSGAV
ncbi:MAG TPA: hypothetical protein VHV55_08825 [Pirellulales bacterium]|nr:hypothetical protein [Pirellulales bacterium]